MAKLIKKAIVSAATVQAETPLVPEQVTTDEPISEGFTITVKNIGGYDRPEPCSKILLKNGETTTIRVETEDEKNQVMRNITQFNCLSGYIALIVITGEDK